MIHAKRLQSLMLGASLLTAAIPSWAVVDSQGGPAVLQLNFQPPVTQIAEQIYDLHTFDADHLSGDFRRCIRCHVLLDAEAPQIAWPQIGQFPRKHCRRNRMDHRAIVIVIGMALPATKNRGGHERHLQC